VLNKYTIYIILDIDSNYFFSIDLHTLKITEERLSTSIGYAPSLSLVGEDYILAIGGLNSDTVHLFDLETYNWIYVGKMQSNRYGAYSIYDEAEKTVYICGGRDSEQDNTLEVEYFSLRNLKSFEIKVKHFTFGFSLRRSFPIPFQLAESTYIICGGSGLFLDEDTNTSTVLSITNETCLMLQDLHPEFSSKNPIVSYNSNYVYFFIKDNEVIKFDIKENIFDSILNENYHEVVVEVN